MRFIFLVLVLISMAACSNKPCKTEDRPEVTMTGQEKPSSAAKDLTQRAFVYKPDGSLQCGMGKKIEVETMKKELAGITVYSSENKNDGLMRIQVCGQPTGQNNVYEISASDLDKALKLGFKKWIRD